MQEEQSLRCSPRVAFLVTVSGFHLGLMHYTEAEVRGDVLDDVWRHAARLSGVCSDQRVFAHGIDQTRNPARMPMHPYNCVGRKKYGGIGICSSELQAALDVASRLL